MSDSTGYVNVVMSIVKVVKPS